MIKFVMVVGRLPDTFIPESLTYFWPLRTFVHGTCGINYDKQKTTYTRPTEHFRLMEYNVWSKNFKFLFLYLSILAWIR